MPESRARAGAARLLVAAAVLLVLAGCATVPSSGPVEEGRPVPPGGTRGDSLIRLLPQPPHDGESPMEIVEGFLNASASFENDHRVARLHLDPAVSARWQADAGVEVYSGSEPTLKSVGRNLVTLSAQRVATISESGEYSVSPTGATVKAEFRLKKSAGEWRISDLPSGLFLSQNDVARSFRAVDLYFTDPGSHVLVPDPVYLPLRRPGLPTMVARALLAGPREWLAPAVRTGFPEGTRLAADEVTVDSHGVADVDLTASAAKATGRERRDLSAQLVWTLRQLPEVSAVRITVEDSPFSVPGARSVQPRDAWSRYDPGALPTHASGYLVQDNRLMAVRDTGVVRAYTSRGDHGPPLHVPAVSLDGRSLAMLSPGANQLRVASLSDGHQVATRLRGTRLTPPSWDRFGNVWTVDDVPGEAPRVWAVPSEGSPRHVGADDLGKVAVRALRVSRDGTRVVAVTTTGGTSHLLVGRVIRGTRLRVEALRDITGPLTKITDVAWASADQLAVLGRKAHGPVQAWVVGVDGSGLQSRGSVPGMVSLAAAPGSPGLRALLAGTSGGTVFQNPAGSSWYPVSDGVDPVYPG